MLWKVGLKEQRERKKKSKVTQELVEKKRKRVTYTNEERRENIKEKEWEKLGEIK